jgi:multiple sugar transport system permease protein
MAVVTGLRESTAAWRNRLPRTSTRTVGAFRATPFSYATLLIVSALLSVPLVFVVSIALSTDQTVNENAFTIIPHEFHWQNFVRIFDTELPMHRFLLNSLIIAAGAVAGQVLSSGLVGYAFARLRAPGKNALFMIVIATMMIPGQITMIPQFILFKDLGWVNTFLPLIVPNFFSNAFNVFLVRQFVSRLPKEIDEAAMVDGLGFFGVYRRIMLPMLTPVLIAIGIFTLTYAWGDFMGPLIYLNDDSKIPLALGVQYITSTSQALQAPPWNLVMVGSILLTLPMIVVYYLGQRYLYEMDISGGSAGVK